MKFKWQLPPKIIPVDAGLLEAAGNRSVLAKLLALRGIRTPEAVRRFLDPGLYEPAPPASLHDLDKGVDRIEKAIRSKEKILVWGDFDVDGQTSTSLLVSALKDLGAEVDYHIPVRAKESHGIKPEFLQPYLSNDGQGIDILLSCDTGIAAKEAVDLANAHNVDVVITDHHDLPATLPDAYALINPKFHAPDHPLYSLPGVGVAYKLIEALYERSGRGHEVHDFLDLVALGIVADIAHQTADTRYLLQKGLEVLRRTNRVGLQAIMKAGKVKAPQLIDEDIGFQIGPRLNAVGRLGDANVSVPLLTTSNEQLAKSIAADLEELNRDRRYKTSIVYDSALAQIERDPSLLQYAVLVLANPEWHQGVIGIVASRLVEDYGKPVILLSSPPDEPARGSARSIEGYHITEAIATQADYLLGFGGHPMAAGMALHTKDIDTFRRGVSSAIIAQRSGKIPAATLDISLDIPLAQITMELLEEVELLAPFGAGNPPVNYLCRNVIVTGDEAFGQDLAHRKLYVSDGETAPLEVIWWGGASEPLSEGELDIVFGMRPSFYSGEKSLRITLLDYQRADRLRSEGQRLPFEIEDCRRASDPFLFLETITQDHENVEIWGEVAPVVEGMKNRMKLQPANVLVIWTIPPDLKTLKEVLGRVKPEKTYLFANDPGMDIPQQLVKRLAGLGRYTLENYQARTTIRDLASACGQSSQAVKEALRHLSNIGLDARVSSTGEVVFTKELPASYKKDDATVLAGLLRESSAFRKAYRNAADLNLFLQ